MRLALWMAWPLMLWHGGALAEPYTDASAGVGFLLSSGPGESYSPGYGLEGHLGYRFRNGLGPDVAFAYASWSGDLAGATPALRSIGQTKTSVLAGVRYTLPTDGAIAPTFALQAGYGYLGFSQDNFSMGVSAFSLAASPGMLWAVTSRLRMVGRVSWNVFFRHLAADSPAENSEIQTISDLSVQVGVLLGF
jgi:hypothetical protein